MKKILLFLSFLLMSIGMCGAIANGTYVLCTSVSDLEAGANYIITNGTSGTVNCISNVSNDNNRKTVEASVSSRKITVGSSSTIMTFTLGGSTDAWTFHTDNYSGTDGYLASAASGKNNYCRVISDATTGTISFSGDAAVINLNPHSSRTLLRYNPNNGTPLFACYSSGQNAVYLYKKSSACGSKITITKGTETNGTYTLSQTGEVCIDAGNASVDISNIVPSDCYEFDEIIATNGTVDNTNKRVTNISANSTITVNFKPKTLYSITLKDSSEVLTQPNCTTGVILPSRERCEEYTFVGWSTTNNTEWTTIQPTIIPSGDYEPESNIDLYPVYTKTEGGNITWEQITSNQDDWSGEYVIVNPDGTHAMTSDFYATGEFLGVSVTITNNKVVSPTDKMIWVVEKNGNNSQYSFKNKSTNSYADITANDSRKAGLNENTVWFTIGSNATEGIWDISSTLYNRCFAYYSLNTSFRTYANSNNNTGRLYKKSGGTTYYISSVNCSEEPPTPPTPEDNVVDIIVWDTAFIKVDIKDDDVVSVSLDDKRLDVVANEADSVFFSKYFEAASNVKLLGIYNGTSHDIDLSDYAYVKSDGSGVFSDFKNFSTFVRSDGEPFNTILPKADELILISYSNTPGDDSIIQCAINNPNISFDKYIKISSPSLDFNGDDAVALVNPEGDFIDLIGAGTKSGGRVLGSDFRSCNKSGKDGGKCDGFMDSPGGWYNEDGIDLHTNDSNYHLATNRCLLVRKNTVKSGLNAVSLNTLTFETLGGIHGEWKGVQIPGASPESADGEGTKNSCKGFDDIGKFDYGNYYGSFEQIYEIDLSTPGVLTDDSVYKLTLDPTKYNLDTLPCTDLKFTLKYRNGKEKEELYKVPIFIKSDSVIDDEHYYSLDTIVCDSCDVVILGGNSLKVNATDTLKNRNVYVYPGATLIIPEGGKYKVNSLTLRRENNEVPYLSYKGLLNIKHGMFFEMRTDGYDWRWLTLPDNLRISTIGGNVRKDDGIIYTLFKHYDGAWRAEHGSGGWKLSPTDTVFNSGSGFIFGTYIPNSDTQKRLYRIPLDTNTLSQEKVSKFVTVYAYGNSNTAPNDKGWNVIGNPYYDSYVTGLDNPNAIRLSRLVKDTLSGTWNGKWIIDENAEVKTLRYIVIKSEETPEEIAAGGYKSVPIGIDNLELLPFTSFFIQAEEDTAEVEFIKTSKKQRLVKANYKTTGESFLRVCIGDNKTGCFISDKFTDEYEIGDDLESLYSFYQLINGYKLLYSAVNDSIIEHGIKVYTSAGNLYLDNKTMIDDFEEINALYNGNWYDLLHGQTVDVSGEFILQAKRKVQNVATGLDDTNNDCIFDKYIQNGNVYIRKNNRIFTVLGELIK